MQHLHSNPPSLCKKKPSISPAVEKVVLKALAKDPQRRFPRVQDFTDALEQALHPLSSLSPQWRIPRRIFVRGLIGLLATGVLVGGGVAIISSVVSTITSSGTMFGFDLQRTNFNPNENMLNTGNVSQLVSYWTTSTGGAILSSPVIANGTLYIGSNDHKLYALDASTGNILWTVTTGDAVYSSPAIANETVYVGSNDHKLYTLDASTGKVLWTVTTGDAIYSSPAVANGMVYVGSNDHKLYTLDASTGKILWTATTGNAVYSSPAIASGTAFVGSNDHRLYALDASTGKVLWTFMTGDAVYSSPAVVNGTVYAGSNDGNVYACDASKGASLWITGESAFNTSLVLTNGVIHAGDSIFYNSTESFYNSPSYLYTSLALTNGVIYAGDSIFYNSTESFYNSPSYLCTLNSSTGKGFWSSKIEDQNSESDFYYGQTADQNSYSGLSSPAVANGIIYVASTDGSLYAIDASTETPLFGSAPTGRILWDTYIQGNNGYKYSDKVFLVSSPLVSDGGVYVGSADGNIYAFHLPGTTPS